MTRFYQNDRADLRRELQVIIGGKFSHEQYERSDLYFAEVNTNRISIQALDERVHVFLRRNNFFLDVSSYKRPFKNRVRCVRRYFHADNTLNSYVFTMEACHSEGRVKVEVDILRTIEGP